MPQPNKIPLAFAASGDKNTIPESTETTGLASWREGFPAITSEPFAQGGIAPKRADFNGIFNALSQAVMWMQQGGVYAYDVNTDYEAGNVVLDAGGLYVANAANGPSSSVVQPSADTTGATWKLVRLDLATQTAAGYMSAADKTRLDSVILTDATPTAAGYMSAADKAALDNVPTTYLPLSGGAMSGDIANADKGFRSFFGGSSTTDGARLAVSHEDNPGFEGEFWLVARANGTEIGLIGKPNGSLTWGGKDVETNISNTTAYYRLSNGLQFLTGDALSSSSGAVTVNFAHAFAENPRVMITPYGLSTTQFVPRCTLDMTSFDFVCVGPNNNYINGASVRWLAFGIGA